MAVVVIGAGISGLTHAWARAERGEDVVLLEAGKRPGGVIKTVRRQGLILEQGPQSAQHTAVELLGMIEALGLVDRIVEASEATRRRYLLWQGKLEPLPTGPGDLVRSPLIPAGVAARALAEPLVGRPKPRDPEESVHEFLARRLGKGVADRFGDPLVAGIFGGDSTALEVAAAFPDWVAAEEKHGSLIVGAFRGRHARPDWAPKRMFTFDEGMEVLPNALAEALGDRLRLGTPAMKLDRDGAGWKVLTPSGPFEAEEVVIACPAGPAAALLPEAADVLECIPRAPIAAIHLAYSPSDLPERPRGFGWLAPSSERTDVLGALWVSDAFPGHARDKVLIRVMVGGARDPDRVGQGDAELVDHARAVLRDVEGIEATPTLTQVMGHLAGIPQYNRGHMARLASLQTTVDGVSFLGWCYTGIGVRHAVRSALALGSDDNASPTGSQ